MRHATILTAVIAVLAPAPPGWAVNVASAPASEVDLYDCLADPPELAGRLDARLAELHRAVEAADAPIERAAAHLATANWLAAVPTSRPAVRWLVGLERPADLRAIAASADQAKEHLERARAALKAAGDSKDVVRKGLAELKLAADSLEPFVNLFATAGLQGNAEKRESAFVEAALGLAICRESDKCDLSACALLWQSFAWERGGRRERAMVSLPNALVRPEQPSFDFLSRLLRCRLLSEEDRHAAAFALALRLRASCEQWFADESPEQLDARQRLAAAVQYRIGRVWLDQLRKSNSHAAAADVEEMLSTLHEVLYVKGAPGPVFVPEGIVPILIQPPAVSVSKPASLPASTPATTSVLNR